MSEGIRVFIGLGSNLGDRLAHLQFAISSLLNISGVEVIATSRIFETDPVGPPPQGPYLNACAELRSRLSPDDLLTILLAIESRTGRNRSSEARWQARTLDLDLLLYGDTCRDDEGLTLPHPRLHERAFVLEPLCELAPNLTHPRLGVSIAELAGRVHDPDAVRLLENIEAGSRTG